MVNSTQTVSLSVKEWRELTENGLDIPVRIQLNGISMQPLIRNRRDFVTAVPLKRQPLIGDIVLFTDVSGRYVAHRVSKLEKDFVITQGDNCRFCDSPVDYNNIWGLAVKLQRGKRIINLDCDKARNWGKFYMSTLPLRIPYYAFRSFTVNLYKKVKSIFIKHHPKDNI